MDKIKKIFRPGGEQDDNVMYGTPEPKNTHAQGGSHDHEDVGPAMLQTDPQSETGKEQGVKSQILNPGGDKYDETRYGTTAHSDKPLAGATTGTASNAATDSSHIDSQPAANQKGGVMRQILNPGGDKYDEQRYGETGTVVPGSGSEPSSTRNEGLSSENQHHTGRDAALGAGAGAAGLGAYEAGKHHDKAGEGSGLGGSLPDRSAQVMSGNPSGNTGNTTSDRSFPLCGGASSGSTTDPTQRHGADEALRQDPSSGNQSHLGRDAALGAGAGALGAGALAHERNKGNHDDPSTTSGLTGSSTQGDNSRGGSRIPGDSSGYHRDDEKPYEGYVHHHQGPHATDMANRLDPHVPGEYPSEDGEHRHLGRDAAIGGAGLGAAGLAGHEASKHRDEPSTAGHGASAVPGSSGAARDEVPAEQKDHHYGRDAALGGAGLGAAGLAGHEANKHRDEPSTTGQGSSTAPGTSSATRDELPTEQKQHHYGRDAALAGGAGAAGVGAYELEKNHGNKREPTAADPSGSAVAGGQGFSSRNAPGDAHDELASQQPKHHYGRDAAGVGAAGVGAHELEKHHDNKQPATDVANDPSSAQYTGGHHYPNQKAREELGAAPEQKQHHYGRDAAIGGAGAGAAGVGAYELEKHHENTGPASKTIGPHDSNVANVVDPRVQPEPSKMKQAKAEKEAEKDAKKEDHHYGRDAAVAGGAGAAGVGAYELEKNRHGENAAPAAQEQAAAGHHDHNKLHKKNDPRGQQYAQHTDDKHDKELQKAREKEAAKHGDHGEKKEGFLHKLLHHGDKDKHAKEETAAAGGVAATGAAAEHERGRHMGTGTDNGGLGSTTGNNTTEDGRVIEPHTGLPMNVGKYGDGAGGTDGAKQIGGYHETDPAVRSAEHGTGEISHGHQAGEEGVAGTDWNAIKKANTPY